MTSPEKDSRRVWLVVVPFVVLALVYSIVTPIFEASDELWHYPVVHHMALGRGLPVQDPASEQLWRQEGSQPPLYYGLGALLTWWIDTSDLPDVRRLNPHADIGVVTADGNVNMTVHTAREAFPYHGTTLAVHIVRWLSVAMGAVTVALTYVIGRRLFGPAPAGSRDAAGKEGGRGPDTIALLAAATVAFNPMFLFISASVNNDNLVVMLSAVALWLMLRLEDGPLSLRRAALLGLVIGLAILSKVSAVGLIPLAGLALLVISWRRRTWRMFFACGAVVVGVAALVCGWWLLRNQQLYGDPLGLKTLAAITGARYPQPNLLQLAGEWQGFLWSFWGLFGGLNVPLEQWTYTLLNILAVLGGLGLLLFAGRCIVRRSSPVRQAGERNRSICGLALLPALLNAAWPVIVFVALIRWTLMTPASQGRLMFSALPSIGLWLALGWWSLAPARFRRPWAIALGVVLLVVAALAPFQVIGPAYARPSLLPESAIASIPRRLDATFDGKMRLLGYQVDASSVRPGGRLPVTLYWQALSPMGRDYSVFVHLLGENDLVLAQRDTYPGRGLWPTTEWAPGQVLSDTVVLAVPPTAYAPDRAQVEVGVYDFGSGARLPVTGGDGQPLGDNVRFHSIDVQPAAGSTVPNPVQFSFEDKLALVGYQLDQRAARPGDTLRLRLYWQALRPVEANYTVFAHILGDQQRLWAQKDSPPQNGAAPTSAWQPGTLIEDEYELRLHPDTPPGVYEVEVGMYLPASGQRLGVLAERGRLGSDRVVLTRVRVN